MKRQGGIRKFSTVLVCLFYHYAQCGPVIRSSRMVREIYPEVEQELPDSNQQQACVVGDLTYPALAPIPSTTPCLRCVCQAGAVQCVAESCAVQQGQQGCRMVARAGQCCPRYTCACAAQGRVYANGERLPQEAGKECSVCYCRGACTMCSACVVGDLTYPALAPIPSTTPCLRCTCQAGAVQCVAESCAVQQGQQGCRMVARAGQCCPRYTCACAAQGRVYANGERLPQEAGKECSVCYCRGGHVQCAEVGCYTRGDCEARFVKGECCPKYDHCPPRDPLSDRITITSPSSISIQSFDQDFISTWTSNTSTSTLGSSLADEGSGDDEIILSDDPKRSSTPITFSIKEIESKGSKRQEENIQIHKADKSPQPSSLNPRITIQEVIPPRTEFVPHKSVSSSSQNLATATYKTQEAVLSTVQILTSSNEVTDSEWNASEKTEVYERPPPVLRIGDQLLFIKQGQLVPEKDASTPSPVITLIGAEGLQIGLGSEEIIDHEILPTNPQVSTADTNTSTQKTTELSEPDEVITSKTSSDEVTTESVTTVPTNLSSTSVDEQSEYIPEENPYYPPIPEDIMNLTQDEITSTENNLSVVPLKNKILPTVLELRNNDTKHMNSTQQWLKTDEVRNNETKDVNSTQQWLKTDEVRNNETKDVNSTQQWLKTDEVRNNETKDVNSTQQWLKTDEVRNNETKDVNSKQQWLKNEPTKISIPLLNEKAAIPDSILDLVAASDLLDEEIVSTTLQMDKIMAGPTEITVDKSKETLELNEELFDSIEFTTIPPVHGSLISSEDASVELIQNDSSAIDTSDLVETVPGFEITTQKITEQQIKNVDGPKAEVEMINISKEHVQVKDFHEEIQKRDVVKKVLKETFENPKENIKIDELEPENVSLEVTGLNEEQNIVKPNLVIQNSTKIITNSTITRQHNSKLTD